MNSLIFIWISYCVIISINADLLPYNKTELELTHQCTSLIYCHGKFLNTVQMAHLYPDSKTFVDMKLKTTPEKTLAMFNKWIAKYGNSKAPKADILKFVNNHFDPPGTEFVKHFPKDWIENPSFLSMIKDKNYRAWGKSLNLIWQELTRKITNKVKTNPNLYSIIYVDNPIVVPGGRFREYYYWDSYWIIRGLLYCDMHVTAKGMIENFMSVIDRFGYIPNGGRIYYLGRSQPPLFCGMVKSYVEASGDTEFIKIALPYMDREYQYWLNNHMITVNNYPLAKYGETSNGPRPESYYEDIMTASVLPTITAKEELWNELRAAAESGMDFSSRCFIKNGTNQGTLLNVKCRDIVPVDLNSILYGNAKIISEYYKSLGNEQKSMAYANYAKNFYAGVQAVLWHDDIGAWLDYDLIDNKRRNYFIPSNLHPLWTKCYDESDHQNIAKKVLKYINSYNLSSYPGGVPTTLDKTGQQWDFPNVWPPLQYILIMGLNELNTPATTTLAYEWTSKWLHSNYVLFNKTNGMFEKTSATGVGVYGGGGEYNVQLGFGWTNGVVLELLAKYGHTLSSTGNDLYRSSSTASQSLSPSVSPSFSQSIPSGIPSLSATL